MVALPFTTRSSPCSICVSNGMCPGRMPTSPATVGITTESIVSEYTRESGVTISRVRGMRLKVRRASSEERDDCRKLRRSGLLGSGQHFVDAALHVEIALGDVVELAIENHFEAA